MVELEVRVVVEVKALLLPDALPPAVKDDAPVTADTAAVVLVIAPVAVAVSL